MTERILIRVLIGSRGIGIHSEDSDYDWAEVFIPEDRILLGLDSEKIYNKHSEEKDVATFPLQKFLHLCFKNNPSILDILFASKKNWDKNDPLWMIIYNKRHNFLSKRVADSYIGYARSQLGRIETHRAWLLNPPKRKPSRADFGLPECSTVAKEHREAMLSLPNKYIADHTKELAKGEKGFASSLQNWNQYEHWKKTRNPARAELEARFGYDTKHAVHLFRLLIQGREILESGELWVDRTNIDANKLKLVRNGGLTYDQLIESTEAMKAEIKEAEQNTTLPDKPSYDEINALCIEVIKRSFGVWAFVK